MCGVKVRQISDKNIARQWMKQELDMKIYERFLGRIFKNRHLLFCQVYAGRCFLKKKKIH